MCSDLPELTGLYVLGMLSFMAAVGTVSRYRISMSFALHWRLELRLGGGFTGILAASTGATVGMAHSL